MSHDSQGRRSVDLVVSAILHHHCTQTRGEQATAAELIDWWRKKPRYNCQRLVTNICQFTMWHCWMINSYLRIIFGLDTIACLSLSIEVWPFHDNLSAKTLHDMCAELGSKVYNPEIPTATGNVFLVTCVKPDRNVCTDFFMLIPSESASTLNHRLRRSQHNHSNPFSKRQ